MIVGRRAALATVLKGAKVAGRGLTVRAQESETGVNRPARRARRSIIVDVELTDISENRGSEDEMQSSICTDMFMKVEEALGPDSDAISWSRENKSLG